MNFPKQLTIAALALAGIATVGSAQATTLSWNVNVDNDFTAYLSTNDSAAGSQIATGDDWRVTYSGSDSSLVANQDYYLHVKATNEFNVAGFLGDFSLSGSDHSFGNTNLTSITTDAVNWASGNAWGNYNDTTTSIAANGAGAWGGAFTGGVDNSAEWIWGATTGNNQDIYFSIEIDSSPVPVPSAVWLFGSGLVGFIGMRKKASTTVSA